MSTYSHGDGKYLTDEQIAGLLRPIKATRVGKDGKGFSHVEAYDIRAHMNRLFGFGRWSSSLESCELVFESEDKPGKWTVCYRAVMELRIHAADGTYLCQHSDVATGDARNMPSRSDAHDMASKTAASQAFKRAAVNLGDQFGLSLYNKGSLQPIVRLSLVGQPETPEGDVTEHITTQLAPENGDPQSPQREVSSPPVPPAPAAAPVAAPVAVVEQVSPPAAVPTPVEMSPEAVRYQIAALTRQALDGEYPMDGEGAKELMAAERMFASIDLGLPEAEAVAMEADAEAEFDVAMAEYEAASADHDVKVEAAATAALAETFGEVAPVEGPAAPVVDPFDWCLEEIARARKLQPILAVQVLHKVMEVAVRKQLRGRRLEGSTETLGAHLVALMQRAGDAAEKRQPVEF